QENLWRRDSAGPAVRDAPAHARDRRWLLVVIVRSRSSVAALPPYPFDAILDGQPLMLRPNAEGVLLGRKLLDLEEAPQALDNLGATGLALAHVITVKAIDGAIRRDGMVDLVNTAAGIRARLRRIAARHGTVPFIDPDSETLEVAVRDLQERRLLIAAPSWDIELTLTLHDPVPVRS